jgi:predicted peptidase
MSFATDEMMSMYPAFVIAPQCPLGLTWSNVTRTNNNRLMTLQPDPSKPMELVIALIQKMKQNASIDTNRIYINRPFYGWLRNF